MKLTIIKPDGIVGVDGVFLPVGLSSLPSNLRAVQWDGEKGHEEWTDSVNTTIHSMAVYRPVYDAWKEVAKGAKLLAPETLAEKKAKLVLGNKADCQSAILAKYSAETQRNTALGLYDYDENFKPTMVDFIARCIAIEDASSDAIAACSSQAKLDSIVMPTYPTE